jgi:hypothetical protein
MIGAANTANMKNPEESKYCSPANSLKNNKRNPNWTILCILELSGAEIVLDAMLYLVSISKVGSKSA